MALYILIAVLCVVPFANCMFLPHNFGHSFDLGYDMPDTQILRRNALGQLQAFDVSNEQTFVRNAAGGISRFNIMEISSDPDVYTNTVGGGPFGLQSPLFSGLGGFGTAGLAGRGLGAIAGGLGAPTGVLGAATGGLGAPISVLGATTNGLNTAASALTAAANGVVGSGFNSLKMPLGMNTLSNYVTRYDRLGGSGNVGLAGRSLGITAGGLGGPTSVLGAPTNSLNTAASALTAAASGAVGAGFNSLKMPLGMNTLSNYVTRYDPFPMMF